MARNEFRVGLECVQVFAQIWAKRIRNAGKVVFASFRDGNRDIYLMDPDGTQQGKITSQHLTDT